MGGRRVERAWEPKSGSEGKDTAVRKRRTLVAKMMRVPAGRARYAALESMRIMSYEGRNDIRRAYREVSIPITSPRASVGIRDSFALRMGFSGIIHLMNG
jgi:hypothetical protein